MYQTSCSYKIYKSVNQRGLKSVRLQCQKLSHATLTTLFSHIHVKSNMESIGWLHTICVNPILSEKVKTLS